MTVLGFQSEKLSVRKKIPSGALRRKPGAAQEVSRTQGWSFFLYEKSVLRESDSLHGRSKEKNFKNNPMQMPDHT